MFEKLNVMISKIALKEYIQPLPWYHEILDSKILYFDNNPPPPRTPSPPALPPFFFVKNDTRYKIKSSSFQRDACVQMIKGDNWKSTDHFYLAKVFEIFVKKTFFIDYQKKSHWFLKLTTGFHFFFKISHARTGT